jgi:phage terminase large subunit-like protein
MTVSGSPNLSDVSSSELLRALHEADLSSDQLTELLNLSLSAQAKEDVFKFGEFVFGNRPAPHHAEMVNFIQSAIEDGAHAVVLEPRGHAKSTWGNTTLLSYLIAKNPHLRVGLMSKSADHADAFSRGIRWTLEKNDSFRAIFGDLVSEAKWTDGEWLRAGSKWHGSKDVTLYAQGVGGQIVSKRFDLILCDDILDKENTATRAQMEKTADWFWQTLYPCLAPGGVIIVLGTRWAAGDLYEQLLTSFPEGKGWRSLVRGALVPGKRGKLVPMWDYFSLEKLEEMKRDMGSARFACAMLNDITGMMTGDVFRREWFRYVDKLPDTGLTFRMGVDLASSTKERADFTAYVITAQDQMGNFYVAEANRAKISGGHARWVARAFDGFPGISTVVIENNQFQSTLISQLMEEYPHIPVVPKRADVDKGTRAEGVAAKYEAGKVFHLPTLPEEFELELLSFDRGHDDWVDSLGYSMAMGLSSFLFGSVPR